MPKAIAIKSISNSTADFTSKYIDWTQFAMKVKGRSYDPSDRYHTFMDTGSGSYLYLINDKKLKKVTASGLWEDPAVAAGYQGCDKLTKTQREILCDPLKTPLYTDGQAYSVIYKIVFDFFAKALQVSSIDRKVDESDNAAGETNIK